MAAFEVLDVVSLSLLPFCRRLIVPSDEAVQRPDLNRYAHKNLLTKLSGILQEREYTGETGVFGPFGSDA
jgi:hypothetical protein